MGMVSTVSDAVVDSSNQRYLIWALSRADPARLPAHGYEFGGGADEPRGLACSDPCDGALGLGEDAQL